VANQEYCFPSKESDFLTVHASQLASATGKQAEQEIVRQEPRIG
jgi:hypothetical protein